MVIGAVAQDYSLVNHNMVPFCLNPALAGNANAIRLGLDVRRQWPTLVNRYTTVRASYDQNFYKKVSSFGAFFSHDNMESGVYTVNEFGGIYSHALKIDDATTIRLGLQMSYFMNYFGYDKLEYGDQYDRRNGHIDASTIEDFDQTHRNFLDFSAGLSFHIENKLTLGASVFHITEPDNGFMKKSANSQQRRYVAHGTFMHNLQYSNGLWSRRNLGDNYFFMNAYYQRQSSFQQGYLGAGVIISPLILGVAEKMNFDDVYVTAFMLGFNYKALQAYYVYDLHTAQDKGSWSHEVCLVYIIQKKERFPCPVTLW